MTLAQAVKLQTQYRLQMEEESMPAVTQPGSSCSPPLQLSSILSRAGSAAGITLCSLNAGSSPAVDHFTNTFMFGLRSRQHRTDLRLCIDALASDRGYSFNEIDSDTAKVEHCDPQAEELKRLAQLLTLGEAVQAMNHEGHEPPLSTSGSIYVGSYDHC